MKHEWKLPPGAAFVNDAQVSSQVTMTIVPVPENFWQRLWRFIRRRPAPTKSVPVVHISEPPAAGKAITFVYPLPDQPLDIDLTEQFSSLTSIEASATFPLKGSNEQLKPANREVDDETDGGVE